MRVVFLGSPATVVAPLNFLLGHVQGIDVVAVVSQPARPIGRSKTLVDPPVAEFAKSRGLRTFQPEKASDPQFLDALRDLKPDLMITAAYGQILNDEFLKIPTRGTINVHPSLLPKYRGAIPVPAALLQGDKITGVTILFTVRKLDAGNVIAQEQVTIEAGERADALTQRLFEFSGTLLKWAIDLLRDPRFQGTPQDEGLVTHCRKILKDDGLVDWTLSAGEIENRFRAYFPWPSSFTFLGDRRVGIEALTCVTSNLVTGKVPGGFTYSPTEKALIVTCGEGNVMIHSLKPAGSKAQEALAFWNGLKDKSNTMFGTHHG